MIFIRILQVFILLFLCLNSAQAYKTITQQTTIGSNVFANTDTILQIEEGQFLVDRMTTVERDLLTPQTFALIGNTTTGDLESYIDGVWTDVLFGGTLALNDLTDVTIAAVADENYLQYNSGSGLWVNIAPAVSNNSDVDTTGVTEGNYLIYNNGAGEWQDAVPVVSNNDDVDTSGVTDGQFLIYNLAATDWIAHTLTAADVLYEGTETVEAILDDTLNSGVLSAIAFSDDGVLAFSWGTGAIYDSVTNSVISTIAGSDSCINNIETFIYWVAGTSLTVSTTPPDIASNEITIAHCAAQDSDILALHVESVLDFRESSISDALTSMFPILVTSGLIVSEDVDVTNTWDVSSTLGIYYHEGHEKHSPPAFLSRVTVMQRHFKTAGAWDSDTNIEIDPVQYNDGTNLVAVSATQYYKSLFIIEDTKIHWVYPVAGFVTIAGALDASPPPVPPGLASLPVSTTVTIRGNDIAFPSIASGRWEDVRPKIGVGGGGGVSSHSDLLDLSNDDHSQYPLMTGRAGSQGIIGGTAATETLTLESTSHATKGLMHLQPNGGNVTIGTGLGNDGWMLDAKENRVGNTGIRVLNERNTGLAAVQVKNNGTSIIAINSYGNAYSGFYDAESTSLYSSGYGILYLVNDGNYPIDFWIDGDDAHVLTPELKMSIKPSGVTQFTNYVELVPVAADLTSPNEGTLMRSDGTARPVGIWEYKNGGWKLNDTDGDPSTIALIDGDNTFVASWDVSGLTNATFGLETTNYLNGVSSYKLTNITGSDTEWIGSPAISVPLKSRGNQAAFIFRYTYDGDDGDIIVQLYDNTNAAIINSVALDQAVVAGLVSLPGPIPTNTTSVELRFVISVENNGKILVFDDIEFSDDPFVYKDIFNATDWEIYSPAVVGFGIIADDSFSHRRVGDSMEIQGFFVIGTSTAVEAQVPLPSGLVIGPTIVGAGAHSEIVGFGTRNDAININILAMGGDSYLNFSLDNVATSLTAKDGNAIGSAVNTVAFFARVPIEGWTATTEHIVTPAKSGSQAYSISQAAGRTDGAGEFEYNLATATIVNNTKYGEFVEAVDESGSTRTKFVALKACNVSASFTTFNGVSGVNTPYIQVYRTATTKFWGTPVTTISYFMQTGDTFRLEAGEFFTVGTNVTTATAYPTILSFVATPLEATFLAAIPVLGGAAEAFVLETAIFKCINSAVNIAAAGNFVTIPINTETVSKGWASLSSNQISLDTGKYLIRYSAINVDGSEINSQTAGWSTLYNVTGSVELDAGLYILSSGNNSQAIPSIGEYELNITEQTTLELRGYTDNHASDVTWGVLASNAVGAIISITKAE